MPFIYIYIFVLGGESPVATVLGRKARDCGLCSYEDVAFEGSVMHYAVLLMYKN
mgnify:CR=1 FL=1